MSVSRPNRGEERKSIERIMSRCLTRFLILIGWFRRTQNITPIGFFYKEVVNLLGGCLTVNKM
jgi:hypothetical protein